MRKTKLVALLMAVVLVASMVVPGVAAEEPYTISAVDSTTEESTMTANAGDEIEIALMLSGNPGISCIAAEITYPDGWTNTGGWDEELFATAQSPSFLESKSLDVKPYYVNWVLPFGTKKSASDRTGGKLSLENGKLYTMFLQIPEDAVSGEYTISLDTSSGRLAEYNYAMGTNADGTVNSNLPQTFLNLATKNLVITVKGTEPEAPAATACPKHTDVTAWTEVAEGAWTSGALTTGHYKLMGNQATTAAMTVAEGETVCVDLNGYKLTAATGKQSFTNAGTLVILDSSEAKSGEIIGNTVATRGANINSSGEFYLYGGTISGGKASGSNTLRSYGGNLFINGGNAYLYGGTITGGTAHHTNETGGRGGNLYVLNATALLDGVTISDGTAEVGANAYFEDSTVTIQGNTQFLRGNAIYSYAGAFYVSSSTVTVQGNAVIDGGTAKTGGGNIYCTGSSSSLTIQGNAQIKNGHAGTAGGNVYCNSGSSLLITGNAVLQDGETTTTTSNWGGGNLYVFTDVVADVTGNTQILGGTSVVRAMSIVSRSSAVLTISGNVLIDAQDGTIPAINNYGSTIKIGAGVTTYSDPAAFVSESEAVLTGKDAKDVTCYKVYKKVADALAAAKSGDKVTMYADAAAETVEVPAGVTLDLNGKKLTASELAAGFTDTHVIDSEGTGKLVVDELNTSFYGENNQLPIYNDGGYVFEEVKMNSKFELTETKATYKFYVNSEAAKTLLDDAIANGDDVKIQVYVTWTANGEAKYRYFELSAAQLAQYAGAWDETMIVLTIVDLEGITDLTCTGQVVANGVTVNS